MTTRCLYAVLLILLIAGFPRGVNAQEKKSTGQKDVKTDLFDLTPDEPVSASAVVSQTQGQVALESTVDPDLYFVGPSDLFSVNIWMSPPLSFSIPVTPEGTLIVPTVGEIRVANLSLTKARELILAEGRKKYLRVDLTVTLMRPRQVLVNVMGRVLNPAVYTLSATDRVSRAIDMANSVKRTQSDDDLAVIRKDMSVRSITVRHHDGTEDRVDLPKYLATHEGRWNPYLREGDIVLVPRRPEAKFTFAVYGQVNAGGRYELVDGDRISGALQIAQGLTSLGIPDRVIFSRLGEDGQTMTNREFSIGDLKSGRMADEPLQPGDRIIVQRRSDQREDFNVDVKGEVVYPGTYPITKERTKLSEVIRMAGGFTERAALGMAYVLRRTVPVESRDESHLLDLRGLPATDDSIGYGLATELRLTHEEVRTDFVRLFVKGDSAEDVVLNAEDQVIVPSKEKTVYVFGQVVSPGHIPVTEGKDVAFYIQRAGGYADHASSGGVKVIKGKTRQWMSPGDTKVEEGDYIWVPSEPNHPFSYYMTIASQAA
ncbi:MAG TPA: SLBB domain-containing protein, partial [Bacteroidota bacterium]|nr:SLBB domain-containing protein [Bacteroidota bacterium]